MTIYKDIKQVIRNENQGEMLETGPVIQRYNAEPGVYIKGDHAMYYAVMLKQILGSYGKAETDKDMIALNAMGDFVTLLQSCDKETDK